MDGKKNKPCLYVCVGLPQSGITTWARETGYPIVSPNAIREVLHGANFRKSAEPLVWAHAKLMVGALFLAGHERVVLDAPSFSMTHRNQWIDDRWDRRAVRFETPKAVCIDRARLAGREDLVSIIETMSRKFNEIDIRGEGYLSVEKPFDFPAVPAISKE